MPTAEIRDREERLEDAPRTRQEAFLFENSLISAPSFTSSTVSPTTVRATTEADAWPIAYALGSCA